MDAASRNSLEHPAKYPRSDGSSKKSQHSRWVHSHSASDRQLPYRFSRWPRLFSSHFWLPSSLPLSLSLGQRQIPRETRYSWSVEGCFSTPDPGRTTPVPFSLLDVSDHRPLPSPLRLAAILHGITWRATMAFPDSPGPVRSSSSKSLRTSLTSFPRELLQLSPLSDYNLLQSLSFSLSLSLFLVLFLQFLCLRLSLSLSLSLSVSSSTAG